jgi:hypothetical protein
MIDKTEFKSQLLKTLQTRELAAENGFCFPDLSQNQIDSICEAVKNLISALSDVVSEMIDTVRQILESLLNSLAEQEAALTWAAVYHPRLCHCAKYSKRLRIQVKNINRIVRLYRKQKEEK